MLAKQFAYGKDDIKQAEMPYCQIRSKRRKN